ncbi:anti-phage ZorAB system protein ZorA, partial [Endozoicomonas sp. ONNA1]|uniref:anti-phage ZorAB system protein ZorA n=1 Tax=Endozoicomonas sp. ONNA1 TaxID=2828740 RepID=UPI0034D35F3A
MSTLISSASIAFMTSVWGVFLSLLFNVLEKFAEGHLRDAIASLQTRIDELYSRITAERTLLGIENHSKVSRDTLNGLAEQIGERMQVAVQNMADTVTTGMEASLNKVMEPAIASLVRASNELSVKQGKSSEDALKKLLKEFTAQLGKAGSEQGAALSQVSQGINSSISQWGDTMSRFMTQLNMTITRLEEMGNQQHRAISQSIGQSVEEQTRLSRESADQIRQVISDLVNGLRVEREKEIEANTRRREQSQQEDAQRQQALFDRLAGFIEKQNGEVNASVSKTASMTGKLTSELKSQQDAISKTIRQTFSDQKQLNFENTEQTRQVIEGLVNELRSEREKDQEAA